MTPMFLEKDESEKLLSIPAGLAFHNFCNLCKYYHFIVSPSAFENFCLHIIVLPHKLVVDVDERNALA